MGVPQPGYSSNILDILPFTERTNYKRTRQTDFCELPQKTVLSSLGALITECTFYLVMCLSD